MAIRKESGPQRMRRLLADTKCECGAQATESRPKNDGSGRYEHFCRGCLYGFVRYL